MPFLNKSIVKVISGALILLILFAGFFALGASYGYAERDSEAAFAVDSNELLHGADFAHF